MNQATQAARFFLSARTIQSIQPFGTGRINDTFLVILFTGERLVLQRINPRVFPDPHQVIANMRLVTVHLAEQAVISQPLRHACSFPVLHQGKNGYAFTDEKGGVWRLLTYISGLTVEKVSEPPRAEELGSCLGLFHRLLSSLEPNALADTLPGFHDTPSYLQVYEEALAGAEPENDPDLDFCRRFIDHHHQLATRLSAGEELTQCIIHGDPKVANFIFRESSDTVISLIDLDTVRSGLLLHDIGDALRSCCNPSGESASPADDIRFNPDLFKAWLTGYCREAEILLTPADKIHIVQAVRVIAFELGIRFLTDHLQGNTYFKTRFPGQNIARALVQFRLVRSIEEQLPQLMDIVRATAG